MNGSLALDFSPIFVKHLAAPGWHLQPFPCFEQSGTLAWLSRGDPPAPGPQGPGRARRAAPRGHGTMPPMTVLSPCPTLLPSSLWSGALGVDTWVFWL